jgi:hypothetical protein
MGRDGVLRRPRRVQRRNVAHELRERLADSARYYAGGDIAARCPYQRDRGPAPGRDGVLRRPRRVQRRNVTRRKTRKFQAPSSRAQLVFDVWNFSGAWNLDFGTCAKRPPSAFLTTELTPPGTLAHTRVRTRAHDAARTVKLN